MFPFMKSFHHFKLWRGLTQKRGSERPLLFFPFWILESELKSSNSLFFTNLFRANIIAKTRPNSTKKLYWLFTKEIIALTTSPTSSSWLIFYPRPTAIYASSHKRTFISLWNMAKTSFRKTFNLYLYVFCFHLNSKSYPIIVPMCFH